MAKTLTSANSVILLTIPGLLPVPTQLQGFAADDIFDTENVDSAEVVMGLDGRLSGGFVPMPIKQNITIQADSDSVRVFENWYAAQQSARELYYANGLVSIPSVQRKYTARRGILSSHSPAPSAKRILQPRRFTITWESWTAGDS